MLSFNSSRALDFAARFIGLEGIRVVTVGIIDEKHIIIFSILLRKE